METIEVHTNPAYPVFIGPGLLVRSGELLRDILPSRRAAVVADKTVARRYGFPMMEGLRVEGCTVSAFTFPPGERSKSWRTLGRLLEFLAEERFTRADCVLALGGGVAGDMAGFAAAVFLRGVRFVQMPTTLLAMVDSSVGGKTAVDLKAGKNLAGAFLQPAAVLCDTDCLTTLPPSVFADGMAEAVKTGVLSGEDLFSRFEGEPLTAASAELPGVIADCVRYKAGVVERDEREQNERRLLNLGHTAGHAIELLSGYAIPHGHAVAAGLGIIARAGARLGWTEPDAAARIVRCLDGNGLPVNTEYPPEELADAALSDKKRAGDTVTLAVPEGIGRCVLKPVPVGELADVFRAGTAA